MIKKIFKIIISTVSIVSLAQIVFAQTSGGGLPPELARVLDRIRFFLQSLAFIIAIIFIILGGYQFLTAGGSQEKVEIGKRYILYAGFGLGIIVLSEILARTVCWIATGNFSC